MKYKLIAVSEETYKALKKRGKLGDTYNDVVTKLLNKDSTKILAGDTTN